MGFVHIVGILTAQAVIVGDGVRDAFGNGEICLGGHRIVPGCSIVYGNQANILTKVFRSVNKMLDPKYSKGFKNL